MSMHLVIEGKNGPLARKFGLFVWDYTRQAYGRPVNKAYRTEAEAMAAFRAIEARVKQGASHG